jgi:hypothetical protein
VLEYWAVMTFRDGKRIRDQWFRHRADAMDAAGLPA